MPAQKVRIPIDNEGALSRFGYKTSLAPTARREALFLAVLAKGFNKVIWRLNALAILNKKRNPALWVLFRKDMAWVQRLREKL